MRAEEGQAVGHLGGRAVGAVTSWIEDVHRTVAGRTFAFLGPVGLPVRQVHDVVTGGSYAAVRSTSQSVGDVVGAVAARLAGDEPVTASPAGGQAVAALDALVGDRHRKVVALDPCERTTLPGTHHFGLLKDPRVADALVGWLG